MPEPRHARLTAVSSLLTENPLLAGIAVIGFAISYQTISAQAVRHGLPGWPVAYPALIDLGILAFVIESRKAIDDGRSDLVPRLCAWLLSAFTIYVNAHGSPPHDWLGRALHVAAPCLWVAFLELTRWRKLRRARAARGDRIPRARWLLSPWRTWGMRRRMILHNVASYAVACRREEARLLGLDLAVAVFGKRWKRSAPALLRHHLTAGTLPAGVAVAAAEDSPDLPGTVDAWITGAQAAGDRAAARARQQKRDIEAAEQPSATPSATPPDTTPARQEGRQPGRQDARQMSATDRAKAHAKVRRLLAASPALPLPDIAARAGVSERTVSRIKNERPALREVKAAR